MLFADSLGGLEGMERVWEVNVRVGFINKLVQGINVLHHSHAEVIAVRPFQVLKVRGERSCSVCVFVIYLGHHRATILTPKHVKLNSRINFTRQENLQYKTVLCNRSRIYFIILPTFCLTKSSVWYVCISLYVLNTRSKRAPLCVRHVHTSKDKWEDFIKRNDTRKYELRIFQVLPQSSWILIGLSHDYQGDMPERDPDPSS